MALTRELIRDGWIQQLVADVGLPGARAERGRAAAFAARPCWRDPSAGEDLPLFAYGSLIWNPAFHFARREVATIYGYHRRFCLWTHLGRGTPERPGLDARAGYAAARAVACSTGSPPSDDRQRARDRLAARDGHRRLSAVLGRGAAPRLARAGRSTFLINHAHERYAGRLERGGHRRVDRHGQRAARAPAPTICSTPRPTSTSWASPTARCAASAARCGRRRHALRAAAR